MAKWVCQRSIRLSAAKRFTTLETLVLIANGDDSDLHFSNSSDEDFNVSKIYKDSSEAEKQAIKESVNNFADGSVSQTNGSEIVKYENHTLIWKRLLKFASSIPDPPDISQQLEQAAQMHIKFKAHHYFKNYVNNDMYSKEY